MTTTTPVARSAQVLVSKAARRPGRARGRETLVGALMASPALILLVLFFLVPAVLAFGLAFTLSLIHI